MFGKNFKGLKFAKIRHNAAFFKGYIVSNNCTFIWVGSDQVWVVFGKNFKGVKVRQNSSQVGDFQGLFSQ